jgi:hypothetical protein
MFNITLKHIRATTGALKKKQVLRIQSVYL